MGKRLKACRRMKVSRMDWISELPDEILIHILSFLTLKEAGRTNLLSKRWTGLWAYVPTLNFDSSNILYNLKHGLASITKEERKYFSWVDRVLSSYKAPIIDELRICFDFQEIRKNNIENWLRFAMQKKVKRLQLDTTPYDATFRDVRFTFPSSSLCNSLTSLELSYVDLSGEVLKKLLYDCHNLEYVSVEESYTLVDLEVSGPLNLKSLRIVCCDNMKHLEISAPNLISFEYFGEILSLAFKSTPKLAVVSIAGRYAPHLMRNGLDLSSCNSQIEVLKLGVYIHDKPNCIPKVFSVFPRLKVLDLTVHTHLEEDLFRLFRLIKACPFLQKLTFKLNITSDEIRRSSRKSRRRRKAEALCHDHLKIAIIDGFVADEVVSEFVMCLIDGAVSLKKITIVPTVISTRLECCVKHGRRKALSRARERARELVENLRPGIEVEIH